MRPNPSCQEARIVSVIIPCLNGAATLPRLLNGLKQQRLPEGFETEVIVVDNGSTNGTLDLLRTLSIKKVYLPGRPEKRCFWKDNPLLFGLNIPFRILLLTSITLKRWTGFYPIKTLCLIPVCFLLWSSWELGVMAGEERRNTVHP